MMSSATEQHSSDVVQIEKVRTQSTFIEDASPDDGMVPRTFRKGRRSMGHVEDLTRINRRRFIAVVSFGAAGLAAGIAWRFGQSTAASPSTDPLELPGAYVLIKSSEEVIIRLTRPEMGQGTMTSMPMLIAEELDVDWEQVRVEWAPCKPPFTDPGFYGVEWSAAVREMYLPLRRLGAGLRELFAAAAAKRWSISPEECETAHAVVHSRRKGLTLSYFALAPDLAGAKLREDVPLRQPKQFRLLSRSIPNRLNEAIVSGRCRYGIDVAIERAATAVLARPPNRRATLLGAEDKSALAIPGVLAIERLPQGIAVVATDFWTAKKGREALQVRWDLGDASKWNQQTTRERLLGALEEAPTFVPVNHMPSAAPDSTPTLVATFEVPYQSQAALEPTSAIADVRGERCDVWMATQNVTHLAKDVSAALSIPADAITVHPQIMGGSFGRKYESDPGVEAALLSQRLKRPIRVMWTREDEMSSGPHRPMQTARLSAWVAENRLPSALDVRYAGPSYFIRKEADVERLRSRSGGFDGSTLEGMVPLLYPIPHVRVSQTWVDFGITVGSWRSTAHSFNSFFSESMVDELAHRAKEDPLKYRLRWLQEGTTFPRDRLPKQAYDPPFDAGRMAAVIRRVAEQSQWGRRLPANEGLGMAIHFAYEGYLALVTHVQVQADRIVPTRAWFVADVGVIVNRSGAEQQLRGGFAFGLTAALYSALMVHGGAVQQKNFGDFRIARITEVPEVDVDFIESDASPGGLGEAGVPLVAPALANAVFAASGHRLRRLPLQLSKSS